MPLGCPSKGYRTVFYAATLVKIEQEPADDKATRAAFDGPFLPFQYSPRVTAVSLRFLIQCGEPQSSSASRLTAGAFGFLTLIQCGERPERYN
jgi:hypothetical protein